MRLLSVDISNYRVIREAHLELPDQVIGIIGPNGSGKSTIVEAISWALYGHQVARSGKEEIKGAFARPSDDCRVELCFELKAEHYRLVRRLVGKGERSEVELYRGGASESIGIAETRGYIETLLGLDWRGFLTSFLARQKELNALTDLAPAKRREHLAGMLGIERIDAAVAKAKENARQQGERVELLRPRLVSRDALQGRLVELREQLAALDTSIGRATGAREAATAELGLAIDMLREQQERESACSRYEAELGALAKSRIMLAESRAKIAAELAEIRQAESRLPALQNAAARLSEVRSELTRYRQLEQTDNLRKQAVHERELAELEISQTHQTMADLVARIGEADHKLKALPAGLEQQLESCRAELTTLRDQSVQMNTQRESLLAIDRKLTKQAATLTELGDESICDRCLRPLNAHDLEQVKQHLAEEQAGVKSDISRLEQQLGEVGGKRSELESRLGELERVLASTAELAKLRTQLESERSAMEQKHEAARSRFEYASTQLAQLGDAVFDSVRLAQLEQALVELEQSDSRLHQLRANLERRPRIEADLAETDQKLAALEAESGRIKEAVAAIGFDPAALESARTNWQKSSDAVDERKADLVRVTHARELAQQELTLKSSQLAESDQVVDEIEKSRVAQFQAETLVRLFGDFRKQLIARIRPRLADLTGQLLADMTDGRYSLVELDEEYQIFLNDYGRYYGLDRFSGGESDLANLCLRLAISQALTESAGLDRSFVILDEVFGSQDESRRDLIVQGLVALRKHFPQMILITHFEELKQKVEMLVELVPTQHGWSEVRVNGALA